MAGRRHAGWILAVAIVVSFVVTAVLGAVFLAGFLSRLVSAEHGAGPVRLG